MLRRILSTLVVLAIAAGGAFYIITIPQTLDAAALPADGSGDATRGERIFWAGGCTSCHASAKATGDDKLKLGGGAPLKTPFGVFHAPNISPDETDGIGAWTFAHFANAMQRGVDPEGRHLYPAFPYSSYIKMKPADVANLFAFIETLPAVQGKAPGNELPFPLTIRRGIGLWKLFFLGSDQPVVDLPGDASDTVHRGRYLVEGPGHCGQCHTPRSLYGAGGLEADEWLAGAPNPEGKGRAPDITPAKSGIGSWSSSDIVYFLESGFTPDFDSVGGSMVEVQENMARLPKADREAIAAYLKAIPAVEGQGSGTSAGSSKAASD